MPEESGQVPTPQPVGQEPATPPADPQNPVDPTPANPAPQDPATPPSNPAEPKTFDETYVKGIRTEAANWRTKFQEAQAKREELERAQMTEQERLQADLKRYADETVPTLERRNRELSVQVAAGKQGVSDPEVIVPLIDWSKVDGGTSVEDAIVEVLTKYPYLKAQAGQAQPLAPVAPSESSPANPPASQSAKSSFTKSQLASMSPAEYEQRMVEIQDAMANQRVDYSR